MRFWLALGAGMLAVFPSHSQMFKCVDERGVTHYTDKPRPGCKGGEVDIRPIPPVGGRVEPRKENLGQQERDLRRRQQERERAEAKDRVARARRCAQLRQELARLDSGRRIARTNERGERVYVDDEARDRRIAQLRDELARCP